MAGNARYTAVLDACVLYSSAIVDSLMSIAVTGIYAAKWTEKIEEEWINSLEKNRPDLVGKLTTRRDAMREAVPDWEIQKDAWNSIINSIKHNKQDLFTSKSTESQRGSVLIHRD